MAVVGLLVRGRRGPCFVALVGLPKESFLAELLVVGALEFRPSVWLWSEFGLCSAEGVLPIVRTNVVLQN